MAHPNEELIDRFYAAFGARDGAAMSALYAPDARFSDPVFTDLTGDEPGAMWRMLTGRATDLRIALAEGARRIHDERGQPGVDSVACGIRRPDHGGEDFADRLFSALGCSSCWPAAASSTGATRDFRRPRSRWPARRSSCSCRRVRRV